MCWKCGAETLAEEPVARTAVCEKCGADLHSCKNCAYYAPGSHYDCHETVDELVKDKERANFCASFRLRHGATAAAGAVAAGAATSAQEAKRAAASLFGFRVQESAMSAAALFGESGAEAKRAAASLFGSSVQESAMSAAALFGESGAEAEAGAESGGAGSARDAFSALFGN